MLPSVLMLKAQVWQTYTILDSYDLIPEKLS